MMLTEESDLATAIMGESSMPKNGYKMPVATDSLRGTQVDGNPLHSALVCGVAFCASVAVYTKKATEQTVRLARIVS